MASALTTRAVQCAAADDADVGVDVVGVDGVDAEAAASKPVR